MITGEQVIADVVALSPALVAIVALLLNYRGFTLLERRMERLEADVAAVKNKLMRMA